MKPSDDSVFESAMRGFSEAVGCTLNCAAEVINAPFEAMKADPRPSTDERVASALERIAEVGPRPPGR